MKNTIFMLFQTFRISRQLHFSFRSIWLSRPRLRFRFWPYSVFKIAKAAWDNRQECVSVGDEMFSATDAWHKAAFLRALDKSNSIKHLRVLCFYCSRGSLLEAELVKKTLKLAKCSKDFYEISQNTGGQQMGILLPGWLEVAEYELGRINCLDDAKELYGYLPEIISGKVSKVNFLRNRVFDKWCSFSSWELMKASGFKETKLAYDRAPENSHQKKEAYDACEEISFKALNEADGDMLVVRSVIDNSIYLGSTYCLAFRILNSDIQIVLSHSGKVGRLSPFFVSNDETYALNLKNLAKIRPLLPPELPVFIDEKYHLNNTGRLMFIAAFNEAFEYELELADTYEKKLALLIYLSEKSDKLRLLAALIPEITEASECQKLHDEIFSSFDDSDKLPLKKAWINISQAEIDKAVNLDELFKALQSSPVELQFPERDKILNIGYSSPFPQNLF